MNPLKEMEVGDHLSSRELLEPIFRNGKKVYILPKLHEIRKYAQKELSQFSVGIKRFLNPHFYPVGLEENLFKKKVELIHSIKQQVHQMS